MGRFLNTIVAKTMSANFDILSGLFLHPVKLLGSKKYHYNIILHLFITLERTRKTRNANIGFELHYIGTFSPNLS